MAKAKKKQALGRGLSALLKDPENDIKSANDANADKVVGNIIELDLNTIEVNPFQPRTSFNEEKLGFEKFQLVSGERRFRASKIAGLETVPAYIRIANDNESLEMALVENIQRQDLDPIEVALSYQRLIDEIDLTQEQLSDRVGKKRSTIANYLRLLKLDPIIQTGMRDGFLSMGHGRALINIEDHDVQLDAYEKVISEALSVRATEQLVRSLSNKNSKSPTVSKSAVPPPFISEGSSKISNFFGAKTEVKAAANGKGKITIPFSSKEDFNRILKLLQRD